MQGAHRPSLQPSLNNAHADIETPSWRKYAPFCDNSSLDHPNLSDDDTTAEAYINRYHHLALEERRRWAPEALNKPSSSTPTSSSRQRTKSQSKRSKGPFFPTPTDAFHLVRNALNKYKHAKHLLSNPCDTSDSRSKALQNLRLLEPSLTYFAEVEENLRSLRTRLKAGVNALTYHRDVAQARTNHLQKSTLQDFTVFYPFSFDSFTHCQPSAPISPNLNQINGTLGHSASRSLSHAPTPPLPSNDSSLLTSNAALMINNYTMSKAESFEGNFHVETAAIKETCKAMARHAHIHVSESGTMLEISREISRALRAERNTRGEQKRFSLQGNRSGSHKLEQFIRQEIDAETYPLLATSFQLDEDYCLDGTRRPFDSVVRDMSAEPEPVQNDRNCSNSPRRPIEDVVRGLSNAREPDQNDRKPWNSLHLVEPQTSDEHTRCERRPYGNDIIGSRARQGRSDFVDTNGFGTEVVQTKKSTTFENDNDLMLAPSTFQASRLDARRKLRQNVKRKLPRIHKERRTRKAFRFRDSAESISSGSTGASSPSPRWNSFREDGTEGMGMGRRPSVTVQFQQVVDLDDKEDGTEPSVVYLDDES